MTIEIDLGDRARDSTRAILYVHSDVKVGHGEELICTVMPREPFRPERLAILATCAESFDLVDCVVAHCSVFASVTPWADAPAVDYAADYEIRPRPRSYSGPIRAVASDEARLGLPIDGRVCPPGHDVRIAVRHRRDAKPATLDVVLLGTVMSDAERHQVYRREQRALGRAWRRAIGQRD